MHTRVLTCRAHAESGASTPMARVYNKYDTDGDNFLQLGELAAMLKDVLPNLSVSEGSISCRPFVFPSRD